MKPPSAVSIRKTALGGTLHDFLAHFNAGPRRAQAGYLLYRQLCFTNLLTGYFFLQKQARIIPVLGLLRGWLAYGFVSPPFWWPRVCQTSKQHLYTTAAFRCRLEGNKRVCWHGRLTPLEISRTHRPTLRIRRQCPHCKPLSLLMDLQPGHPE